MAGEISMNSNKDKVIIFDTTLRDGEQTAGAGLTADEKLRIARYLQTMKVDVIDYPCVKSKMRVSCRARNALMSETKD